jgi:hypothetical protein
VVAGGAVTYENTGALTAGTQAYGDDVSEFVEAGALTTRALSSGADVVERIETGSLTTAVQLRGADVATYNETGTTPVGTLLSGDSDYVPACAVPYEKTGSLTAGTRAAGTDVFTAAETGALTTRAIAVGADSFQPAEAGSLTTRALSSGADVFNANETGTTPVGPGRFAGASRRSKRRALSSSLGFTLLPELDFEAAGRRRTAPMDSDSAPMVLPFAEFSACRPSARSSDAPRSCFTALSEGPTQSLRLPSLPLSVGDTDGGSCGFWELEDPAPYLSTWAHRAARCRTIAVIGWHRPNTGGRGCGLLEPRPQLICGLGLSSGIPRT